MDDSAQKNNQQTGSVPVDTSLGDGMSAPPFPIGGNSDASQTPTTPPVQNAAPPIQVTVNNTPPASSSAPIPETPAADTTGGNTTTINVTPPPPGDGQTVTTFKPVRGKFGPKGILATVFGVLVLVAATIVGVTQVGQVQIFREKAGDVCSGGPEIQCTTRQSCNSDETNCGETTTGIPLPAPIQSYICCKGPAVPGPTSGVPVAPAPGDQTTPTDGSNNSSQDSCSTLISNSGCVGSPTTGYTARSCDTGTVYCPASSTGTGTAPGGGTGGTGTTACTSDQIIECDKQGKGCSGGVCVTTTSTGGGTGGCTTNADCTGGLKCNSTSQGLRCTSGTNVCQAGEAKCGDYCATTNTDKNNCGACGTVCGSGQTCQGGSCKIGANTCAGGVWEKWTCVGADKTTGSGCQEGTPQITTTQPEFDSGFCGVQQIDCSNNTSLQFAKEDKSGCSVATGPTTGNTMGCNGCDCGVIDANGSNNRQNCYWDGNACFYSEAACSTGPNNGKAKCASIGLQLNGQFTKKNGKVANGWHAATLSEVQALQAGDKVRILVTAGSANGANPANMSNFTKGRVAINGGSFIEFTDHDDFISNNPNLGGAIISRTFRYEYTIPAGITNFLMQGQVFYSSGQNPGWH